MKGPAAPLVSRAARFWAPVAGANLILTAILMIVFAEPSATTAFLSRYVVEPLSYVGYVFPILFRLPSSLSSAGQSLRADLVVAVFGSLWLICAVAFLWRLRHVAGFHDELTGALDRYDFRSHMISQRAAGATTYGISPVGRNSTHWSGAGRIWLALAAAMYLFFGIGPTGDWARLPWGNIEASNLPLFAASLCIAVFFGALEVFLSTRQVATAFRVAGD
jgi:hypothetical protein